MMLTIGAVLLVLITVVLVILTFRVEEFGMGFGIDLKFRDKDLPKRIEKKEEKLPEEKEKSLEEKDQKYLR